MRLNIPFGKDENQVLDIPAKNFAAEVHPNEVPVMGDEVAIREGLDESLGLLKLEDLAEHPEDVLVIVNDATRPTPTPAILKVLAEHLDLAKPRYLVATGAHRAPTESEYHFIFGEFYDQLRRRVHAHDSRNDPCASLGLSCNGTEMLVNELVVYAKKILVITSVEPHYFAGYTGGRKSFLPGVAAFRTIEQNHRLAMRKEAASLALKGNPVHEDMMDALCVLEGKEIFAIQAVLDRQQRIYKVRAGDLHKSFAQAVKHADEVFAVPIKERADIVISIAHYPMDIDLYQSQKAMENGKLALKHGGTLIFVSKCREGIGEDTFYRQLAFSKDPHRVVENLNTEYKLGYHKAAKMAEIQMSSDLYGVTSLQPEKLEAISIKPFRTVQEAFDAALVQQPNAQVLVIFDGSVVVPKVVGP